MFVALVTPPRELGVKKSDQVIIYLPMIAEAIVAMQPARELEQSIPLFSVFLPVHYAIVLKMRKLKFIITANAGLRGGKIVP